MARISKKQRRAEMLLAQMQDENYNPLQELIKISKHSRVDVPTKVRIAMDLMNYVYPRQKAVEVDHKQGQQVTFNFDLTGDQQVINQAIKENEAEAE